MQTFGDYIDDFNEVGRSLSSKVSPDKKKKDMAIAAVPRCKRQERRS